VVVAADLGWIERVSYADPVVVLIVQRVERAGIAGISLEIAVRVRLRGIRRRGAVVVVARLRSVVSGAGADAVAVGIVRGIAGAGIARIPERVAVGVGLVGVRSVRAVVAHISDVVRVGVDLIGAGDRRTVVACIPEAVTVGVGLISVDD